MPDDQGTADNSRGRFLRAAWPTPVRWTANEMILVLLFGPILWNLGCADVLRWTGFYDRVYGSEKTALVFQPKPGSSTESEAGQLYRYRFQLWSSCLAFFFQFITALFVFRKVSGTTPRELGLTTRQPLKEIGLGLGSALVLTPVVALIWWSVITLWKHYFPTGVQEHPFSQIGQLSLYPAEWVLLVMAAVVFAPVWEELTFRGILQPWLASRPQGGHLALGLALLIVSYTCWGKLWAARAEGPAAVLVASLPVLPVLPLWLVLVVIERRSQGRVAPALFGTAVLFAWVHAAWPSPLPLLVLGLGLGYLAYRTGNLVASITLHAAFNGANCALLLLSRILT
jgi:membrane protease YdiL (CAAX protease family)